jgi:hypothetical protein
MTFFFHLYAEIKKSMKKAVTLPDGICSHVPGCASFWCAQKSLVDDLYSMLFCCACNASQGISSVGW